MEFTNAIFFIILFPSSSTITKFPTFRCFVLLAIFKFHIIYGLEQNTAIFVRNIFVKQFLMLFYNFQLHENVEKKDGETDSIVYTDLDKSALATG